MALPSFVPDQWHYLLALVACLAVTLPLEVAGARVYRRPRRLAVALAPASLFLVWDVVAIAAGVWEISGVYTLGVLVAPGLPVEEVLFFVTIPLCALLTFETVRRIRVGERT
ncbi:lycopene cyclase domain-containing protein [Saccharomonospora piscinae]|uniref:Lycopene cyclase n=1 Tax=Saccharomonospora piscinae TaxID=687388 RepID=A0A1V9AAH3_SACPI|nr:lycopene cyclase domain-containing protein [Saccharomonospora piscinae]OQO94129.1 lycopene cyclase [Saccharomonospora piscinae]TLW94922.1 lycopene cyclase domain-containing protein [Saccharomonospora piscinae]